MKISRRILLLTALLFMMCSLVVSIDTKKKSQQPKQQKKDKKPSDMEPHLYCVACQAVVREVLKQVKTSTKDYEVSSAMDKLCQQRNFPSYDYPPPEMVKGCQAFLMGWEEKVETAITKRVGNGNIEHQICYEITKACVGVSPTKGSNNPGFVTVNDKKVAVGADGKVDITGHDL